MTGKNKYSDEQKNHELEMLANRTVSRFLDYQQSFRDFKKIVGLEPMENVHEPVSGIVDKLGRLVRHIKHNDRNDPKVDWKIDAPESFQGIMAYLDIIMQNFNKPDSELKLTRDDLRKGMITELMKAVKQHSKGEVDE